ncbi:MAG: hypothetical protein Q9218_004128 [Villophora microphyllina]
MDIQGLRFTSPFTRNNTDVRNVLAQTFPSATPAILDYITQTLYSDNSTRQNTSDETVRAALIASESLFSCNTRYLSRAFGPGTYDYVFAIPPGLHGQDIPYMFYNGGGVSPSVGKPETAVELQKYITNFIRTGKPDGDGKQPVAVEPFEPYGANGNVKLLGPEGPQAKGAAAGELDPTKNARCDWWQQALYAGTQ